MALSKDVETWLRLSLLPGLGDEAFRRLLVAFRSPEHIFAAGFSALRKFVSAPLARAICEGGATHGLDAVAAWLADPANAILTLGDLRYPPLLLEIPDPPPVLYVKGRTDLLGRPALAMVGSRNATPQGAAIAESFAKTLSDSGLTIVSGLASGIDAGAHRGGLAGVSRSIAILGTGIDIVYPARNRELAHALAADGALVTEFPLGTAPLASNFPRRNRLISGFTRGCLVIEAALQSGSLITAKLALEHGREVFAVPGSIHSPLSKGCHALIKQGAKLVETAQDVLEELGMNTSPALPPAADHASPQTRELLDSIGFEPCDIDTLCARSGLGADVVSALLTELEVDGTVAALPGGRYQRIR